jgi:glycosyltransferase involved in cell wall biosynthesis
VRIRHISTPIRAGLNAKWLYHKLADFIITTSQEIRLPIAKASGKSLNLITCVPTGVNPLKLEICSEEVEKFKLKWNLQPQDLIIGSLCVVRSWKGIEVLIQTAHLLRDDSHLKWIIIGGGYLNHHKAKVRELQLEDRIIFTGHLDNPKDALASLDIFMLLSSSNEGISQATLQASYLQKPLITTATGGLKEVCLDNITGLIVPIKDPHAVMEAILKLKNHKLRSQFGQNAFNLVKERFLFEKTLQDVENIYMRFSC